MAVFQIGRLFADYDVDITSASFNGNRLSVRGDVILSGSTKVDQGKAIREQIVAMQDNGDEPFVAVQWSQDSTINGFYRVRGIGCDIGQMTLVEGYLSWSAELDRVMGYQYPPLESVCSWQLVTNNRSVTAGTFTGSELQWAVPGTAFDLGPVSGTVSGLLTGLGGPFTLATGFGSAYRVTGVTVPASGIYGWSVDPADYYFGACTVTTDFGSATDQTVFGRWADGSTNWMVSNGIVRIFVEAANETLTVEHWESGAWRQANSTNYRFQWAGTTIDYDTMTVLRNSPECVVVRLGCRIASTLMRVYVDLMLMRGSAMVYGYMSILPGQTGWSYANTLGIQTTASVASTAVTGGFRATTADANGLQFVLVTGAPACTDTLATGRTVTTSSTTSLSFGISAISAGAWSSAALDVALEFFARRSEVTRVVAR